MVSRLFALVARRSTLVAGVLGVFLLAPAFTFAQAPAPTVEKAGPAINLNTASAADLENLPGIGAKMAERILEYRQKNGPFKKIEDLMNVKGIGEKNFLKLKARLTVASPKGLERWPAQQRSGRHGRRARVVRASDMRGSSDDRAARGAGAHRTSCSGMSLPAMKRGVEHGRLRGAAFYLSGRVAQLRMQAVHRGSQRRLAIQFNRSICLPGLYGRRWRRRAVG